MKNFQSVCLNKYHKKLKFEFKMHQTVYFFGLIKIIPKQTNKKYKKILKNKIKTFIYN